MCYNKFMKNILFILAITTSASLALAQSFPAPAGPINTGFGAQFSNFIKGLFSGGSAPSSAIKQCANGSVVKLSERCPEDEDGNGNDNGDSGNGGGQCITQELEFRPSSCVKGVFDSGKLFFRNVDCYCKGNVCSYTKQKGACNNSSKLCSSDK